MAQDIVEKLKNEFAGLEFGEPKPPSREVRPLIEGSGILTKVLSALNLPQQAVFGAAKAAIEGKSIPEGVVGGMREKPGFAGVMRAAGAPEQLFVPGVGQVPIGAVGLAGDVLLDPLNLIPFGAPLKAAQKVAGKIPAVASKAAEVASKTGVGKQIVEFGTETAKRFRTVHAINRIIDQSERTYRTRASLIKYRGARMEERIKQIADDLGTTVDDVRTRITRIAESKRPGATLSTEAMYPMEGTPSAIHTALRADGVKDVTAAEKIVEDVETIKEALKANSPGEALVKAAPRVLPTAKRLPRKVPAKEAADTDRAARELVIVSDVEPIYNEAMKVRNWLDSNFIDEQNHLLGTAAFSDMDIDYVPHILREDVKEALVKRDRDLAKLGRRFNARHAFQLQRKWRMSIEEINKLGKDGKLPGLEGVVFKDGVFKEDPVLITTVRLLRGERAMADARVFLNAIAEGLGTPKAALGDAWKDTTRWAELRIASDSDPRVRKLAKYVGRFVFPPDVARHLDRFYSDWIDKRQWLDFLNAPAASALGAKIQTSVPWAYRMARAAEGLAFGPDRGRAFLHLYDSVQNVWKGLTLAIWPAYHARNTVGNIFNNTLAGLWNPEYYVKAAAIQKAKPGTIVSAGNIKMPVDEFRELMVQYGIAGQFGRYMAMEGAEPAVEGVVKGLGLKPSTWRPVQRGFAFGSILEDNARIAHVLYRLDQGDTIFNAAMSAKKYLFDYDDLSRGEKIILRRVMPFYAWTRKNVPLQIRSLMENPKVYQGLGDIISYAQVGRERLPSDIDKLTADYIKRNTGIPVSFDKDGNPEYFLLGGWLPAADIEKLADILQSGAELASPLIRVPVEVWSNRDLIFGGDIETFPGDRTKIAGVTVPARMAHVLQSIRIVAEADRLIAMAGTEAGKRLTTRAGENLPTYAVRLLTGAKVYPVRLAQRQQKQFFDVIEAMRGLRQAARGGRTEDIQPLLDAIQPGRWEWTGKEIRERR